MTVNITTFDNGLRVVTDTMDTVESVTVGVWIGAGTRVEVPEENGVAHLLEHMAFKGTDTRSAQDIAEEIEAVGGHLNAYTSREQTAYYAKVLKEDTPLAFDILGDILRHSRFDPEELAREREVVLQEIAQAADTPDDIIFDHFQAVAYPDQPLGWPVLGRSDSVRGLQPDALRGFMTSHYRPDSMIVTAAGRIDHETMVTLARRHFGDLPGQSGRKTGPANYQGGEFRDPRPLEQLHLALGFQGMSYTDESFYALSIYSTLLGGGMSSRLFQEVREKRGLAYAIYSFASYYHDDGVFGIYAGTAPNLVTELIPVICDQMLAATDSLDEVEINRARAQLKAGLLMARENTGSRCESLAQQMLIFNRPIPPEELVERINAVDRAAVQDIARRIVATPPALAAVGPVDDLMPVSAIAARLR